MAKPAKSAAQKKKELIDEQDYLSEEQKEAEKKKVEKTAGKASTEEKKETDPGEKKSGIEVGKGSSEKKESVSQKDLNKMISDIESVLDEVIFIQNGEITLQKSVDAIREENGISVDALFREVFRW